MSPAPKQKRRRKKASKSKEANASNSESAASASEDDASSEDSASSDAEESAVEGKGPDSLGGDDDGLSDDELDEALDDDDLGDLPEDDAPARKRRTPSAQPSSLLRMAFYAVWIIVLPIGLAVVALNLLKPDPHDVEVGAIREFVGGQQVPATILLFTFFAIVMWFWRHRLPLAGACGVLLRADVPAGLHARYESAVQLLADAERIMSDNRRAIRKELNPSLRSKLEEALANLEDELDAGKVDRDRLLSAHEKAADMVRGTLGRWHKGEVREYAESIGVAVGVALILRFFVIEAFKIPSGSMIPTLMVGDHIFVAKYSYGPLLPRTDTRLYDNLPPKRADVMVFKFPENKKQDFIKRAIALPGDKLEALNGRPVINGMLLPNCYVGEMNLDQGAHGHLYLEHLGDRSYMTMFDEKHTNPNCESDRDCGVARACRSNVCGSLQGPYRVAKDEVWVMGDNRNNSHDSRSWKGGMGAGVPFENIKGRAMFVWWSMSPRRGFATDRVFVNVMGTPRVPDEVAPALKQALADCLRNRPPVSETTPPAP